MNHLLAGQWLLTVIAAVVIVGGFIADMGETHMFNPRWPPHAKFHNAQTIGLGVFLGAWSAWFTWTAQCPADVGAAVISGTAIYASWLFATLMPNTAWTDSELLEGDQTLDQIPPQLYLGAAMISLVIGGSLLEANGLAR